MLTPTSGFQQYFVFFHSKGHSLFFLPTIYTMRWKLLTYRRHIGDLRFGGVGEFEVQGCISQRVPGSSLCGFGCVCQDTAARATLGEWNGS